MLDGAPDDEAGLLPHFAAQCLLDRLTVLDRAAEPGPAARISDPGLSSR